MKKIMKVIFSVVSVISFLGLLGCDKSAAERVEITMIHGWGSMEEEHVRMREIYTEFEKYYPHIKLNLISMPSSEVVVKKVKSMLSVGKTPDLIFLGGLGKDSVYSFMVENNKALDLIPYLVQDPEFKRNIAPEFYTYYKNNEKLYTISDVVLATGGYWYNESILKQAGIETVPNTWDDFFIMCDIITRWSKETERDVVPVILTRENSTYLANSFLLDISESSQKAILSRSMKFEKGDYLKLVELLKKIRSYDTNSEKDYGYRDVCSLFNSEKTALYVNGVWAGKLIREDLPVKYAAFPGKNGKTSSCLSACIGYVVGNTGDVKKMEASVTFLKYILSREAQEKILVQTGQMPSSPQINLEQYKNQEARLYQSMEEVRNADRITDAPINFWGDKKIECFQNWIMQALEKKL